ncbi:MAG: methyl viologen-reducing hydrogenase [Candidatus Hydrothermarchaeales archaeon]
MATVVYEELGACAGCECNVLDIGDDLIDILPHLEFVHFPLLMDRKYYGQEGDKAELEIPEADIGILAGSVVNEENKHVAEMVRKKVKILIANGACAISGGIPALKNMFKNEDVMDYVFRQGPTTDPADPPSDENLPKLLDRVYAVDEIVKVDVKLPGCPTSPALFAQAVTALLEGKEFKLEEKSVCDTCPQKREKKALMTELKRNTELPTKDKWGEKCILEQGYLCMGPATKAGCATGIDGPRCILGGYVCRGCFGPIREEDKQMVAMMTALSALGINLQSILDRKATFNQFVGAHNQLRPIP